MTQRSINRAVARATGESPATIARLGFSIADPKVVCHDPEPSTLGPLVLDWDDPHAGPKGLWDLAAA